MALAAKNFAQATESFYQASSAAAGSSATLGYSGDITIDVEGSKTHSNAQSTQSIASNIVGNNIKIDAGGDATISGSNLDATELLQINAEDVKLLASKDTSSNTSDTKNINASLTIGTAGVSGSIGGGMSQSRSSSTTYNNTHLNANNMVIVYYISYTVVNRGGIDYLPENICFPIALPYIAQIYSKNTNKAYENPCRFDGNIQK